VGWWGRDNDAEDAALTSEDSVRIDWQERADLELRQEQQEQRIERELKYPYPSIRALADTFGDELADRVLEEEIWANLSFES